MRAIGLFSGGLDSILAAELVRRQGIEVVALSFFSPFFSSAVARRAAERMGLEFVEFDITEGLLAMLPRPRYGYGAHINPCIDCKALMLRAAGRLMLPLNAAFIFSGEVLGQRPMSQNKQSLRTVARLSSYEDYILRPLSAQLLPETPMEIDGRIRRERLRDFSGRGRQRQIALADELGIRDYPSSAGGCRLTEPAFARRLRRLYETNSTPSVRLIELLKLGRHVRVGEAATLIVGRNESENNLIEGLALPTDTLLRVRGFVGPTGILTGSADRETLLLASSIVARYSDAPRSSAVYVVAESGTERSELRTIPIRQDRLKELLI